MKLTVASLLALVPILALATPTPPSKHCPYRHPKHIIAKYDDLPFSDFESTPIPDGYNGLSYQNFYTDEYDGFIKPASYNNTLISYDYRIPRIITVPEGVSKYYTFTPKSVYVGCSSGYPQADCFITLVGTKLVKKRKKWEEVTVKKKVVYPALDNTKEFTMLKVDFPKGNEWRGLKKLEFADVGFEGRDDYRPGFIADDFEYVLEC